VSFHTNACISIEGRDFCYSYMQLCVFCKTESRHKLVFETLNSQGLKQKSKFKRRQKLLISGLAQVPIKQIRFLVSAHTSTRTSVSFCLLNLSLEDLRVFRSRHGSLSIVCRRTKHHAPVPLLTLKQGFKQKLAFTHSACFLHFCPFHCHMLCAC